MRQRIHPERRTRARPARLLAAAIVAGAVLLTGCGAGSSSTTSTAAHAATATGSSTATHDAAASSGSSAVGASGPLAFAECMRANGVPSFPDPQPGNGGRFVFPAGPDSTAPAFRAAQAKCQKFLGGGPPGPGSTTHPSAQTLEKLLKIAQCMRRHRVPQFPDPQTSVPSNPAGIQEISDFDGAILLFPATLNLQAPAYKQALTACGAPPLGLPH